MGKERVVVGVGSCSETIVLVCVGVWAFRVMVCVKKVVEEAGIVEGD